MYFHSHAAKSTAKTALKGHWPTALGVCAILLLTLLFQAVVEQLVITVLRAEFVWGIGGAPDALALLQWNNAAATVVSLALTVFVYLPVHLGVMRWFWRFTGGAKDPVGEVFYYFGNRYAYGRAMSYIFSLGWRFALAGVVVYLPYVLVSMITGAEVFGPQVSTALSLLLPVTGMFSAAGAVLYIAYILRYFLAPWLLFSYEDQPVKEILRQAVQMSKGYKSGYVGFACTFIGWLVLCILVFPLLYVAPLLLASMAVYCRYCINHYLRAQAGVQHPSEYAPKNIF